MSQTNRAVRMETLEIEEEDKKRIADAKKEESMYSK